MHEISVLTKAVELVESVARDNGLDHVSFITLEVGELTGYVPLFFEKYFPASTNLLTRGSVNGLASSSLSIGHSETYNVITLGPNLFLIIISKPLKLSSKLGNPHPQMNKSF